jgi:hypothetical protein
MGLVLFFDLPGSAISDYHRGRIHSGRENAGA